ncbi:STAS domain-containing protein [Actinoplanes derwentensis]|uniref:Anti-sigma factor antagonist n=1 Tax=Actinoplanes derwentensis TaxID=113562 RepID=A0A1H2CW45_9ACTN|nr:STAS domain-containing protein [Actinoplanes derwentensis]GID88372.1 hypothetical protein Ade03nite_72960 [Actinoplanes derwentensis]SDT74738.1 anti-anti-sigma factor [Actinoplanes derwentensis]
MVELPLWSAAVTIHQGTRTVALTGELDLAAADQLLHLLRTELDTAGTAVVVVDLAAVSFLDSAALAAFVGAYNHADAAGLRFQLVNPVPSVRRVLDISGVYEVLVPSLAGDD